MVEEMTPVYQIALLVGRMWMLAVSLLPAVACVSNVEPSYPTPESVTAMQGVWKFDANASCKADSTTYTLDITDGTMVVGETTSEEWPYYCAATLNGTSLRCRKGNSVVWEVPVEGLSVSAGRAILAVTLSFRISTPLGTLTFDCRTWRQEDKTGPDEWSGTLIVDERQTVLTMSGVGSFTGMKKR
jgi:hypothetical protein